MDDVEKLLDFSNCIEHAPLLLKWELRCLRSMTYYQTLYAHKTVATLEIKLNSWDFIVLIFFRMWKN